MADLKISALNSLAGADLVAADVVAVVDDSASETKKLTVSDLIANGVTLISNSTIPSAKILFSAGSIATASVVDAAVTTAKVADSAITAAKLADNSSVTLVSTLPASGDFTGQIALDTDDDKIYIWDGSAWDSVKAAGSINVVNGSTSGIVNITTSTSGDTVTVSTTLDDTSAAANFLAGPTGAGGTVGYRAIAGSDLPKATSSTKGAVVVNGNGLTMSNDEIQINNSVTAETTNHHVVQYDANGLITAGRQITGADIPSATSSVKGSVFPGTGLAVTAAGELNHSNNITGGTFTKVTVDTEGHVTATTDLVASDIPDLPASKITTGTLPTARLANDAITADKLANESTTKFIGAGATDNVVTFPDGDFKGQFAYDEKNEDLYVYTGNSFIPITVISGNLVNAGTYNASTNLISSVTTAGSAAGFTSGGSLPTPATTNLNYYVVVDTSGTGSGAAPSVSLAPPDMLVSLGTGATFQLVDVSNAIAGQTAANISVVPVGSVAATDAQAAIQELDTEKLPKAGGTMTGNLELGTGIVIVFEGATANDYETTLTVTDPTADRTITLPNETGTVLTTGASGAVTSAMIADGAIVNADINASAEIAVSKLANGTARQLLQTDSTGAAVEFTSNIDVPGTLDCTGAGTFDSTLTVTGVINADGKVKFPAGTAALPSFYNGTDTDTGLYFSAANEISVSTAGTQRVVVDSSGRVGFGTATPGKKVVVNHGTSDGLLLLAPNTGDSTLFFGDSDDDDVGRIIYDHSVNGMKFRTNASEAFRVDSSQRLLIGTTSSVGNSLLQIQGDAQSSLHGASLFMRRGEAPASIASGELIGQILFTDNAGGGFGSIECEADAAAGSSDYPGRLIFSTSADGASTPTERVRIDSSGNVILTANLDLQDNDQIQLGDSADLRIYHDGSNSYIKNNTGVLRIHGTEVQIRDEDSNENLAKFFPQGAVELYYDNSKKFATKSDGIDVTGEVQCDSLDVDGAIDIDGGQIFYDNVGNNLHFIDNVHARFGTGSDLRIYHDGGNSRIVDSGTGSLVLASSRVHVLNAAQNAVMLNANDGGSVELYHNGSKKLDTKSDGVDITGELQSDSLDVDGVANIQGVITAQAGAVAEIDALTDAATITPDLATSCNFSVTLAGNRTLANPSNITAGQSGSIFVTQDGTGSRTLAFGSYWDFAGGTAPTLTTTASAVDRIDYIVRSSTSIHAVATLAYS